MVADMQGTSSGGGGGSEPENFMEIWAHNLEEGFDKIRRVVEKYPYVAMVSCHGYLLRGRTLVTYIGIYARPLLGKVSPLFLFLNHPPPPHPFLPPPLSSGH